MPPKDRACVHSRRGAHRGPRAGGVLYPGRAGNRRKHASDRRWGRPRQTSAAGQSALTKRRLPPRCKGHCGLLVSASQAGTSLRPARSLLGPLRVHERSPLMAHRAPRQDSTRPSDRLAIGSALLGGLLVAAVLVARTIFSGGQSRPSTDVLGVTATRQPTHVLVGSQPTRQ